MSVSIYRYRFIAGTPTTTIRRCFKLALIAAESLYSRVRLFAELEYYFDRDFGLFEVTVRGPAGEAFNKIFLGLLNRFLEIETFGFTHQVLKSKRRRRRTRRKNGMSKLVEVPA